MGNERRKLAVLISGRGSNMEAILQSTRDASYPASIALALSDNPEAQGLTTAKMAGISSVAIPRAQYSSKHEHEQAVMEEIDAHQIDLICLAGYMRILSSDFTDRYSGRMINIHPSLLPKFKGLNTHQRALDAGEAEHGCTIHYVNAEMDGGQIISQARVTVLPNDTADTLGARVLAEEHKLYPEVIRQLCS